TACHITIVSVFFFYCCGALRHLHSFPTRRSSDLPLARAVCGFIALFWGTRLFVQFFLFDARPFTTTPILKLGYHGLTIVVVVNRSEEHTSELQSRRDLVCRLLLEKKKKERISNIR